MPSHTETSGLTANHLGGVHPPARPVQTCVRGLEAIRFCFSAATNREVLTKQQETYTGPIPKTDQNGREILMGSQGQKAES